GLRSDLHPHHQERLMAWRKPADDGNVGQRLAMLAAACAVAAISTAAATGASRSAPNWAAPQIGTVVQHKLMARSVKKFRPHGTLTQKTLTSLAADLKEQLGSSTTPPPDPGSGGTTTGTT